MEQWWSGLVARLGIRARSQCRNQEPKARLEQEQAGAGAGTGAEAVCQNHQAAKDTPSEVVMFSRLECLLSLTAYIPGLGVIC